jgi:sulfite reductase (NADPH) hemoprotein beta-component
MIETETAVKLTRNEGLKSNCPTLSGTIGPTLANAAVDRFTEDDYEFLKFHGIYQQDDRDKRKVAKQYIFMVRGRLPGGVVRPEHYLTFDRLATEYGNNTLRITSRQGFQFHGIVKSGLGPMMKGINDALATTLAACGDVNRNVMAASTPSTSAFVEEVQADARKASDALLPKTAAYHQIWVEGKELALQDEAAKEFVDPLYGKTYLPRKFKVAFAIPPVNDLDVFINDVGFIAIVENDKLAGYNIAIGGGMGRSHGNEATYPRLADVIGFVGPDKVVEVTKAVLTIHRDFGDRTDRKHARLKYVIAERGVDWARAEVEKNLGFPLAPAKPYQFTTTADLLGWRKAVGGSWFLGLFVDTGRVKDANGYQLKTALREVADKFQNLEFRLSANQNIIIVNASETDKAGINTILTSHGVKTENQTTVLHAASMACPALPTCGLALAESERMLPGFIDRIEKLLAEVGLAGEEIIIRSTGCPNGCARPYMAEIGFVGKAPGRYQVWLGGDVSGTRLNRIWKDVLKEPDLETEFRPVFARFAEERNAGERFGDWCDRVFLKEQAVAN